MPAKASTQKSADLVNPAESLPRARELARDELARDELAAVSAGLSNPDTSALREGFGAAILIAMTDRG